MANTDPANTPKAAWQAFAQGKFSKANAICVAALKTGRASVNQLPLAEIWTMRAYHRARTGSLDKAYTLLKQVLSHYPEDRVAQQMMLIVEDNRNRVELATGKPASSTKTEMKGQLVLGIGTGRNGSTTLSELLAAQPDARVTHELPPILSWDRKTSADEFHVQRFKHLLTQFSIVGDVAHWWLPKLDEIIQSIPSVRIVALKREKQETVNSFLKIKGGNGKGAINHWTRHNGEYWTKNTWDPCYPKYHTKTLKDALGLYWDNYYHDVELLLKSYPKNIRIFSTDSLSKADTQKEVLSFVGLDNREQVLMPGLRRNRGTVFDGARMN